MAEIGVDRRQLGLVLHRFEQGLAHPHQHMRAAGREVQAAQQFLPARLGGQMQRRDRSRARRLAIGLDRPRETVLIGAEALQQ